MSVNRASLSIAGLYIWDDEIFSGLTVPEGVNKGLVCNNILLECGELNLLYPDWQYMCAMILQWSTRQLPEWERIWKLAQLDYNPIENYDRNETETLSNQARSNATRGTQAKNGGIVSTQSGGDETTKEASSGSTAHNRAGFNGANLATSTADDDSRRSDASRSTNQSNTNATQQAGSSSEYDMKEDHGQTTKLSRIHGNIGVTTTQQMMQQEIDIGPQLNLVRIIVQQFKEEFCIMVY